jgi:DNA helicase IV
MIPIGLDGSVKYVNIPRIINLNTSDRVALIVKDLSVYDKFKQILETNRINKLNVIHNDEDKILKGYLNIIPINLTKGLEFEVVYVVNHNMTQNEFYVASTRALNKLFIINSLS